MLYPEFRSNPEKSSLDVWKNLVSCINDESNLQSCMFLFGFDCPLYSLKMVNGHVFQSICDKIFFILNR